jgi:lipoprotein-anchoring transpeptidase ErfK/SrfK
LYDATTVIEVRRFQGKFVSRPYRLKATGVVDARTYTALRALTKNRGLLPATCRRGEVVCVDKTLKLLRLVRGGRAVLTLDARFGGAGTPTREGKFRVRSKDANHTSSLFHTWMPWAMFFSGGQAVHYSPYFHRDGYRGASHGCVNLRDWKGVQRLFRLVRLGTRVVVYHH